MNLEIAFRHRRDIERSSVWVDVFDRRADKIDIFISMEKLHLSRKSFRQSNVIVIQEADVFPACLLQCKITRRRDSPILVLEKAPDAIVDLAELLDDLRRSIARSVVDN